MNSVSRYIAALTVLLSGFVVATSGSRASVPTNNWGLEPSTTSCVVSRSYGSPQSPSLVGVKATPDGGMQIAIVRPVYRREVGQNEAEVVVGGKTVETTALSYPLAGRKHRSANLINLSPNDAILLRKAATVSVTVVSSMHENFDVSTMADAWKDVDSCLGRLRETWNIGEEQADRIATPAAPITPLNTLFSDSDYPFDAIQANQSGGVKLLLLIDEAGAVQDCTLIETSGVALLDSRSCSVIMKGAKFKPATDVQGRPMKSSRITVIKWMIAH